MKHYRRKNMFQYRLDARGQRLYNNQYAAKNMLQQFILSSRNGSEQTKVKA